MQDGCHQKLEPSPENHVTRSLFFGLPSMKAAAASDHSVVRPKQPAAVGAETFEELLACIILQSVERHKFRAQKGDAVAQALYGVLILFEKYVRLIWSPADRKPHGIVLVRWRLKRHQLWDRAGREGGRERCVVFLFCKDMKKLKQNLERRQNSSSIDGHRVASLLRQGSYSRWCGNERWHGWHVAFIQACARAVTLRSSSGTEEERNIGQVSARVDQPSRCPSSPVFREDISLKDWDIKTETGFAWMTDIQWRHNEAKCIYRSSFCLCDVQRERTAWDPYGVIC